MSSSLACAIARVRSPTQPPSATREAVFAALDEEIPGGLDYVRVQLSEDYDQLFSRRPVSSGATPRAEASPAG